MPLYDYSCEQCGAEFEIQRSMTDRSKVRCTECKSLRTTKIFSATGIHFKGSGFYVTDSKNSSENSSAKSDAKEQSKPASTPQDPKPAKAKSKTESTASNSTSRVKPKPTKEQ